MSHLQHVAPVVRGWRGYPVDRMKLATVCLVATAWIGCPNEGFAQTRPPAIVLNGGNGMGLEITRPVLEMAGGTRAVVAVVIDAQEPGEMAVADWKRAQPAEVIPISARDVATSRPAFDRATLIWFAGGFTTSLMDAIRNTFLPGYIRERWAKGVVVGGDSAGGMIFPHVILISGPADLTTISAGQTKTTTGMGLLPNLIFDAHFVKRQRLNRLISLVLEYPDRLGVGADERTAVVITGRQLQVLGASNVIVLDARAGNVSRLQEGQASSGRGLAMHVLVHGMALELGSAAPRP